MMMMTTTMAASDDDHLMAGGRLHSREGNPAQHTAACSAIPNIVFMHNGLFSTSDSIAE
jgi:hypothetical protein